jgi:hypothetical protein
VAAQETPDDDATLGDVIEERVEAQTADQSDEIQARIDEMLAGGAAVAPGDMIVPTSPDIAVNTEGADVSTGAPEGSGGNVVSEGTAAAPTASETSGETVMTGGETMAPAEGTASTAPVY